jgi:hypothetical protein
VILMKHVAVGSCDVRYEMWPVDCLSQSEIENADMTGVLYAGQFL